MIDGQSIYMMVSHEPALPTVLFPRRQHHPRGRRMGFSLVTEMICAFGVVFLMCAIPGLLIYIWGKDYMP
jgi:hypothetical protein